MRMWGQLGMLLIDAWCLYSGEVSCETFLSFETNMLLCRCQMGLGKSYFPVESELLRHTCFLESKIKC